MLKRDLIDEFVFFIAPKILGSDGFAPFALHGITSIDNTVKLTFAKVAHIGQDLIIHAYPEKPACSPV
jgi:diaminohydroxyphosphoribosylaminopyrimidine deaminase/5-amino-6-(5-phosphoribosylamino)uracil reductase